MESELTHKAIATTAEGEICEISLPTPHAADQPDAVLVRIEYAAVISFDVYMVDAGRHVKEYPFPLGLGGSGVVVDVGPGVERLKVGDRVITFAGGVIAQSMSMQEYALLSQYCVSQIPDELSFPEATTIPENFATAYWTVFSSLRLPLPATLPANAPPPEAATQILVYGAGTSVGQYVIQVLRLAGYRRILATASQRHHTYLHNLGATETFDYSRPDLPSAVLAVTGGAPVKYVVGCVTAEGTLRKIAQVVGRDSIVAMMMPIKEGSAVVGARGSQMWMELPRDRIPFPEGVDTVPTLTFAFSKNSTVKESLFPKILPNLLVKGHIQPNRVRLLQEGTFKQRAEQALELLRHNRISCEKIVMKVSEHVEDVDV